MTSTQKEIADAIEAGMHAGRWRSGDRLPSLRELAEQYGVTQRTAASAYNRLIERRLARSEQGRGYFMI